MEGETQRGRGGTNNKRAAVAQRGCQVQSGVGRQDSQGAATGGESWETCVSCLPRLQTTSLCFTGPFFPSAHRQPPPPPPPPPTPPPTTIHATNQPTHPPPSTLHHPEKNTTGLPPYERAASYIGGWRMEGEGEGRMKARREGR